MQGLMSGTAVAVSRTAEVSVGAGTMSLSTKPTDTVDPKAALPHSYTLLATTVLGRFSDADAHTATEQW